MRNNNFISKIAILLILVLSSCSDSYLEIQNQNSLVSSSFYQTQQDFEELLVACYSPLGFQNLFGSIFHVENWAMDDRIIHEQFNTSQLQFDATRPNFSSIYIALYTGIFRTNLFLQKLTDEISISEPERSQMLAQVHFLRGLYYFYTGMLYEVSPLLTVPSEDPTTGLPNSTQEDIYKLVEDDFKYAMDPEHKLPVTWDEKNLGRVTIGAAQAFLGKLYLYQARFDEAETLLKQIITEGTYSLNMPKGTDSIDYVYAYLANFTQIDLPNNGKIYKSEFNSESIFEVNFSDTYDEGARSSQYLPMRRSTGSHITWFNGPSNITGGYGNVAIDDIKFPKEFESPASHPAGLKKDPRFYAIFMRPGDTLDFRPEIQDKYLADRGNIIFKTNDISGILGTTLGLRKYLYPFHSKMVYANAPFNDPKNWRLMRYADVLLMYAEAAFRSTGNATHADGLAAINLVRERAGMAPLTTLSKNAIVHERDIELAGEHLRYWDLVRWYKDGWMTITEVQVFKPTFQPKNVCWPIPYSEIQKNFGVLKQNPKWN